MKNAFKISALALWSLLSGYMMIHSHETLNFHMWMFNFLAYGAWCEWCVLSLWEARKTRKQGVPQAAQLDHEIAGLIPAADDYEGYLMEGDDEAQ